MRPTTNMRQICELAHRAFVRRIVPDVFDRQPTEHEMKTMGIVAFEAGFNAMLAEHARLVKPLLLALQMIYDLEMHPADTKDVITAYRKETE